MEISHEYAGMMKSPEQEETNRRRLVAAWALVLFILCWVKLGPWLGAGLMTTLVPLCVAFAMLAYLSPPVAAALFFMGNYFFGNLSIAFYPRVSFLAVIAAVLVGALLYVRWKRGELARFLNLPRRVWLAIAALALFFLIGYVRAIWQLQMLGIDLEHSRSVFTAFQASLRGSNGLAHYMFLSHWLSFITIGALACLSYSEIKTFFLSLSILFVVQLLSIPFPFYAEFFRAIYVECQPMGLGYLQINRGHLGYMAVLASALALTIAHDRGALLRAFLLTWWVTTSVFVFLSGTRGPVLAWILVMAFVICHLEHTRWLSKVPYGILAGVLLAAGTLPAIAGYSVVPCGTAKKLVEPRHSVEMRLAQIKDLLYPYVGLESSEMVRPSTGEAVRFSATDAVRSRGGVSDSELLLEKYGHIRVSAPEWGLGTWLFGKGFGGATRSVDPETGVLRMHSGTLNLLVDFFIETGIIGVTFFVLAMTILIHCFHKAMAATGMHGARQIAVALNAMMLVLLVKLSVSADTHTEDSAALVIGLLIGLAGAATAVVCGTHGKARRESDGDSGPLPYQGTRVKGT